jgi:thioredoxin:protein disulfide reductase
MTHESSTLNNKRQHIMHALGLFFVLLIGVNPLSAQVTAAVNTDVSKVEAIQPRSAAQRLFGNSADANVKGLQNASTSTSTSTSTLSVNAAASNDPLPVEQAFVISATRKPTGVSIQFLSANGYYLYREKFKILATASQADLTPALPPGVVKYDETFGKNVATFRGMLSLPEVKLAQPMSEGLSIDVYSQGCADIGICYPPQYQRVQFAPNTATATIAAFEPPRSPSNSKTANTSPLKPPLAASVNAAQPDQANSPSLPLQPSLSSPTTITLPVVNNALSSANRSNTSNTTLSSGIKPASTAQEPSSVAHLFQGTHPAWLVLAFIGFGLLLTFTPCVLPMVPIVSAIVLGGQPKTVIAEAVSNPNHSSNTSSSINTQQAFLRSSSYVLGMCVAYTALGVLAGLAGQGLAGFLQQAWVLYAFAVLMVLLAGAQFGWYRLTLPAFLSNRAVAQQDQLRSTPRSGVLHYLGIAVMGALSALMVGPCLTAPLAGVLTYIAQTGDAWLGGLALFGLSLGMGIPLLLVGVGGARCLPKTGAWMEHVNYGFGLMLLAVAVWMVQSLLPAWLLSVLWLTMLVLSAQALGAFRVFSHASSGTSSSRLSSLLQALGFICLVWAIAMVWGMAAGRFDPLSPLKASDVSTTQRGATAASAQFETIPAAQVATRLNQVGNTPIMLDIYADWCVSCIEFEHYTFADPRVAAQLAAFTLLRVDVTQNTVQDRALLKQLGLFGPPAILFFTRQGDKPYAEDAAARVIGFQSAELFLQQLKTVLTRNR